MDLVRNDEANANVLISNSDSLVAQEAEVIEGLSQVLGADAKLDAIICVAGGWAGGSSANKGKSSILPLLLWITPPPPPSFISS